jgi:(p)ppGpp synthase/HD superfamily hydrolase
MIEFESFLTRRFDTALQLASALHHSQCRKGTNTPYISHLMAVSALVLESGGDEDMAIAALLHDAVEDQGGEPTLMSIRRIFGDQVADLVSECSETIAQPKPPWLERKKGYLAHLKTVSEAALIISVADKLHNARSILADYRVHGDDLWKRFNASKADELWYFRELVQAFQARGSNQLVEEFSRVVGDLERLANAETTAENL